MSTETAAVPRVNDNHHGIEQAFDGNVSTRWVTMSGEDKISAVLKFPNKIEVGMQFVLTNILGSYLSLKN